MSEFLLAPLTRNGMAFLGTGCRDWMAPIVRDGIQHRRAVEELLERGFIRRGGRALETTARGEAYYDVGGRPDWSRA